MPDAFLYDIGNVIVKFDFGPTIDHFVTHSSAGILDPLAAVADIKQALEGGTMGDDEFVETAIEMLHYRGTREDFIRHWQHIFSENKPMCESIRAIAAQNIPLYLLSNTSGLHVEHLLEDFDIFECFQAGIYSHEAKCMKPDDQIYQIAIEKLGLDPGQTIYVDDLPANIETGTRLGFLSHHYDYGDHEAFLAFAEEHGVPLRG